MFATVGTPRKERTSKDKDKKSEKKRKRQSDGTSPGKPFGRDPITVAASGSKSKSKKPRTDSDSPLHIQPLDTSLTPRKGPAVAASIPFKTVTTRLYLPLSPLYSPYPWLSLESDHLDPLILTYYPPLRGIILSYRNIRFNQRGARIQGDSPFAFTWVTVDFLLWCPKKKDFLEGWVNLQSESHIGLLVLNTFNVSVPRGKIPEGWRWCEKRIGFTPAKGKPIQQDGERMEGVDDAEREEDSQEDGEEQQEQAEEDLGGWMDEDGNYVDGLLRFKVEGVKASGHIIAIEGNLLESDFDAGQGNNNTVNFGDVRELPIRPVGVSRKAEKVLEIATLVSEEDEAGGEAGVAESESPIKERKKEKKDKKKKKERNEKKEKKERKEKKEKKKDEDS